MPTTGSDGNYFVWREKAKRALAERKLLYELSGTLPKSLNARMRRLAEDIYDERLRKVAEESK